MHIRTTIFLIGLMVVLALFAVSCNTDEDLAIRPLVLNDPVNPTKTSLDLSWSLSPATDYAYYRLYYSTQAEFDTTETPFLVDSTWTNTSMTVSGLESGELYFFRVYAGMFGGYLSDPSNEVSARTLVWEVVDTIDVGDGPVGISIRPEFPFFQQYQRVYVANQLSNNLSVLSVTENNLIGTIENLMSPWAVAVSPNREDVFVSCIDEQLVKEFPSEDLIVSGQFDVGNHPLDIACTLDSSLVVVTDAVSNNLTLFYPKENRTETADIGAYSYGVAVDPDGMYAYVSNVLDGEVTVYGLTDNIVHARIPVGEAPQGIAISIDGLHVYVANSGSNTVSVLSTVTWNELTRINVGECPVDIAVSPDNMYAYVANHDSDNVTAIHIPTNTVSITIDVGDGPMGIAVTPDGAYAYVSNYNEDTVSKIGLQP